MLFRSGEFLPCSFICCIFLWVLILFNLVCLGSPFCRLQVHSSRYFWCLPPVGVAGSVACVGFLAEWTVSCVLVGGLYIFLLVGKAASGGVFFNVCDLSMTSGSLSANGWDCVPVLLVVWHGVSSTGA